MTAQKVDRSTPLEELPEILTLEEFRNYLGMGKTTAYELVRTGQIDHIRFGRRIWIPKEVLKIKL